MHIHLLAQGPYIIIKYAHPFVFMQLILLNFFIGIEFTSLYDFPIGLWTCSHSVVFFVLFLISLWYSRLRERSPIWCHSWGEILICNRMFLLKLQTAKTSPLYPISALFVHSVLKRVVEFIFQKCLCSDSLHIDVFFCKVNRSCALNI